METCDRTFILVLLAVRGSKFQLRQLAHQDVCVAIHPGRPPVIEVVGELTVATHHQVWFEADTRQAVMPAGPSVPS